jgi:sugar fermentation stimulation protein A
MHQISVKYPFEKKLSEGLIKSRPNRFIMQVEIEGRLLRCHCPSTGRIGSLRFRDIPCLLSKSGKQGRKTPCTVEAISLDPPEKKNKKWVGINQVVANRYVEFFLVRGKLARMVGNGKAARRERKLGRSRIDFAVENTYIEVKTLLMDLDTSGHPMHRAAMPRFVSFQRLIKHFGDLSAALRKGSRAIVLLCYLYDAKPFHPPPPDRHSLPIEKAAMMAEHRGVENWQINLVLDREGVRLAKCFPLRLF